MPKGVKWRGHSVNQINDRLAEAAETGRAIYLMQQAAKERMDRLELEAKERLTAIAEELKDINPSRLYLSKTWDCTGSPTDRCIYDADNDWWHDRCLFCGEPEDRG